MAVDPRNASTELSTDALAELAHEEEFVHGTVVRAQGPWRIAARRLRRNKVALGFLGLFFVVVAICLAAPVWADNVAKRGPKDNNEVGTVTVDGKKKNVVSPDGVPIGPTWQGQYFLGADGNGRDTAVRLLYGGRNSLIIGISAALITALLSVVLGILSGFFGGVTDSVISRSMDVVWAFPVILLGVALGTALGVNGLKLGPITLAEDSKLIPVLIIGFVYVPYLARPIRGQVMALRQKEFVEAAEAQGAGPWRIMFSEVLPNLTSTIIVFLPLAVANAILLEAALSFVGAGVRAPETSWGTMIAEGIETITSAPHQTIVPGLMLVITVLGLNVFGDGVRDAFDPRAKIRVEH
ncbi:MAG TPA: ABC transporter permease [Thermoleophilaceae bacterium]|nr:ABC transporter permease [Thermoleophilaceae bacterium]